MTSTSFKLQTNDGTQLSAEGANHEHLSHIIQGIFGGVTFEPAPPIVKAPTVAPMLAPTVAPKGPAQNAPTAPDKGATPPKPVSAPEPPKDQVYSIIREDRFGTPTYQAEYDCPNCGDRGTRFIWSSSDYMKCHKCSCQIEVFPTMPRENGEVPKPDKDGFFFYGDSFFDNLYEQGK